MSKSVRRGSRASKKTTTRTSTAAARKSAAAALTREKQAALYDQAMKLFTSGDFAAARKLLDKVATGPNLEMAHAARTHSSVCGRRLDKETVKIETPEDHYNYAVTLINRRELESAEKHLKEALSKVNDGDHIHYALALCYGLSGETSRAREHLRTAIRMNPKNRTAARNDSDFDSFASDPEISSILRAESAETD